MRFIAKDSRLETDDGQLIKVFSCPLEKKWDDLMPWPDHWRAPEARAHKRLCGSCGKCVVNFQQFSESQIIALVQVSPEVCGHLTGDHPDLVEVVGALEASGGVDEDDPFLIYSEASCTRTQTMPAGERIVRTARSLLALREGVDRGLRPYFLRNDANGLTHQKFSVVYDAKHQRLHMGGDYRSGLPFWQEHLEQVYGKGAGLVLNQDFDRHPSPIAAYLLPSDIRLNERIYLEDLIEDRVGSGWNQGDRYRARSSYAIWNGNSLDLEISDSPDPAIEVLG